MDTVIFRHKDREYSCLRGEINSLEVCFILGLTHDKISRCTRREFSNGVKLVQDKENLLKIHDVEVEADPVLVKAIAKYVDDCLPQSFRALLGNMQSLNKDYVCICMRSDRDRCKSENFYEANIWNTHKSVAAGLEFCVVSRFTIFSSWALDNPANIVSIRVLDLNYDLVLCQGELDHCAFEDIVVSKNFYTVEGVYTVKDGREIVFCEEMYTRDLFLFLVTSINMHMESLRRSKIKSATNTRP